MKKLVITLCACGIFFGLTAAKQPSEISIQVINRTSLPAIVTLQGKNPACSVTGTLESKAQNSFVVPCAEVASLAVVLQAQDGAVEKQFNLNGKRKFTIDSNTAWINQALNRFEVNPAR